MTYSFTRYGSPAEPLAGYHFERDTLGRFQLTSHPNFGIQQPAKPVFAGKVFSLMNGGSQSTTAEFLSVAHSQGRVTLLGEEAGGDYRGHTGGEFFNLTLPNSRRRVQIPLMRYQFAVSGGIADHGVLPDEKIMPAVDDLLAGRDVCMLRAYQLASVKVSEY
jgi:C-terminal processing protease CtpA/Prc